MKDNIYSVYRTLRADRKIILLQNRAKYLRFMSLKRKFGFEALINVKKSKKL